MQGQFAGAAVLVGVAQDQRQADRRRGGDQAVRVGVGKQCRLARAMRAAETELGPDSGRPTRNPGQPGAHAAQGVAGAARRASGEASGRNWRPESPDSFPGLAAAQQWTPKVDVPDTARAAAAASSSTTTTRASWTGSWA